MAHKTLIGGTAYEVSGGRTLVAGTEYNILKGRTFVGGTEYDIVFEIPISTFVFHLDNGRSYEFEEGMTWRDFVNSSYNDGMFTGRYTLLYDDFYYVTLDGRNSCPLSDLIIPDQEYILY